MNGLQGDCPGSMAVAQRSKALLLLLTDLDFSIRENGRQATNGRKDPVKREMRPHRGEKMAGETQATFNNRLSGSDKSDSVQQSAIPEKWPCAQDVPECPRKTEADPTFTKQGR